MNRLFIVCGSSGSGKTTLAMALAKKLNIALISKDSIKEVLYHELDMKTLDESKKAGNISMQILESLTEEQLSNKANLIIEAPFIFEGNIDLFTKWGNKYQPKIYIIHCKANEEELKNRFMSRPRHHSHHDKVLSKIKNTL